MPTKTRTTRPRNSNRATAIDPRLARVHALIQDTALHGGDQTNTVINLILSSVDWSMVDLSVRKTIFSLLMANSTDNPSADPDCDLDEARRVAIMKIVDDEHESACACCRSRHGQDVEFRAVVSELQALDPNAVRRLLKTARKVAQS